MVIHRYPFSSQKLTFQNIFERHHAFLIDFVLMKIITVLRSTL